MRPVLDTRADRAWDGSRSHPAGCGPIRCAGLGGPRSASLRIPVLEGVLPRRPLQLPNSECVATGSGLEPAVCPSGHLSLSGTACPPGHGPIQTTPVSSGRTSVSWAFSAPVATLLLSGHGRAGGFARVSSFQDMGGGWVCGVSSPSLTLPVVLPAGAGLAPRLWLAVVSAGCACSSQTSFSLRD